MIPGVPYDAEIEYLESTGTQWIDTGVVPNGLKTTIDFRLLTNAKKGQIAGCHNPNNQRYYPLEISGNTISFRRVNRFDGVVAEYGKVDTERHITVYYFDNKAFFDGIETQSNDFAIQSASYSCILFSITINGVFSADNAIPMRMYSCRMENDTTLIRDFIPVRVGQTGYMYDRVSKRLFGNKGTGSFVLGPDVAKPVMGLWGMRKFYNTTDYVQDGLVAMWDGINNTGHGHDPEATVWKDLVGDRDFTLNGAVVGGNNISWNGNYKSTSSRQPPAFVQMEIVFKTLSGYGWKVWFGDYGHSIQTYVSATIVSKTAITDNSSYRFYVRAVSIPLVDPGDNKKWATEIYENSVKKNISKGNFNYTGSDFTANTMQIGGGAGLSLHNVRLYSRYLSDAEIAHNYAIDKARFNLP